MRRHRVAAAAALTLALTALATEVALPSVAEKRVRDELATVGTVTDVEISSSPAVKMLFSGVDKAVVRMSAATLDADDLEPDMLLDRARDVEVLDVTIDLLRAGPLHAESVAVTKDGSELAARATVDVDQIQRLVPGARLTVEGGDLLLSVAELPLPLPLPGPVQLQIGLEDGAVVARPLGPLAALMPAQRLLARPELSVTSLHSSVSGGEVTVTAEASLVESSA